MLTSNIWQQVGLCNGSAGIIKEILYQPNHTPPELPIAVLVNFNNYTGPPFLESHPKCVPIPPLMFEWDSNGHRLSRQQLPLKLRYAVTIRKSQGLTLDKAAVDIGKSELAAGCTFVALSRARNMSFQRLQAISSGKRFQQRLQEARLKHSYHTCIMIIYLPFTSLFNHTSIIIVISVINTQPGKQETKYGHIHKSNRLGPPQSCTVHAEMAQHIRNNDRCRTRIFCLQTITLLRACPYEPIHARIISVQTDSSPVRRKH